jgi:MOSC domain-containing protein YiiM
MTGSILQVSISRGGLPKRAIAEGDLTEAGFAGDSWAHPRIHGGPDQAVLLIANEAIEWLRAKGFPVYPGALGENLTTTGFDHASWRTGQRYRAGEAIVELTKLREPCKQLDIYGPAIKKEIAKNWALGGFYARVVRPGLVFPGSVMSLFSELA